MPKCFEQTAHSVKLKCRLVLPTKTYFGSGIFFQRVSNEDQIFEARKLSEVIKLPPLSDVVVRDVEHLQLGQTSYRLQPINLLVIEFHFLSFENVFITAKSSFNFFNRVDSSVIKVKLYEL